MAIAAATARLTKPRLATLAQPIPFIRAGNSRFQLGTFMRANYPALG
jgi:hypothetical protein